ncbi:hypothetical protein E4U41_007239, partial [Claviceps citrina]
MERDRDARGRRYDDGEVVRYGAGESWRPTPRGGPPGDRSPRRPPRSPVIRDRPRSPARDRPRSPLRDRPRSPLRDRPRSPLRDRPRSPLRDRPRSPRARSPRPRSPVMPSSDSYVPGRYPPRRRSRSGGDRFLRRERSRDRESPPRRRERTRSPPPMRRSPIREMRFERPRSPRRDWERGREQDRDRERDWDRERMGDRDRGFDRRDESKADNGNLHLRRRSRSPYGRERRERSPPMKSPLMAPRGGTYRPRSRSLSRGRVGERYQPYRRATPMRESGISSAITSRPASERASPRPSSVKARSPMPSREQSPHRTVASGSGSARGTPRSGPLDPPPSASRSPPRGPAALRGPPAPPGSRTLSSAISSPLPPTSSRHPPPTPGRTDAPSPTNPPAGPRGYVPPSSRGAAFPHRIG